MGKVMACCVCLATDVKLYDLFEYNLNPAFETLTGINVLPTEYLPQSLCSYCRALLTKCQSFRAKALRTQELLKYSPKDQDMITTDYLHSIDRDGQKISLPYKITETKIHSCTSDNTEVAIKAETIKTEPVEDTFIHVEFLKEESETSSTDDELNIKNVKKDEIQNYDSDILANVKTENEAQNYNSNILEDKHQGSDLKDDIIDVVYLSKQEQIEELLKRKESQNYLNSFHKCDLCYKGFIMDVPYRNHMVRHDPSSGPEVCDVCRTHWPDARTLHAHKAATHERRYKCRTCGVVFRSCHRAAQHRNWHSGYKYVCKVCGATFDKSSSHLTHVRLQHPSEHGCDICGESFISQNGLNMHKRKAHKRFEALGTFPCDECGKTFLRRRGLTLHKRNIHNDKTTNYLNSIDGDGQNISLPNKTTATNIHSFPIDNIDVSINAEILEETSIDSDIIKEESQTSSSDDDPLSVIKGKHINFKNVKMENELQNYNSDIVANVKKEIEVHNYNSNILEDKHQEKNIQNDLKDVMDVVYLSREEQIEDLLKRKESQNYLNSFHKCDLCYKGFIMDVPYRNHMVRHDPSSGPEVCDICRTHWPNGRALRAHKATTHERRYTCRTCGLVFRSCHRAAQHRNWHSGHKYICKVCGATFDKCSSHLTHVRLQHPSEHCCDICGESFISRHGLNMHTRKAHKGFEASGIFPCDECGKTFLRRHGLALHKKNIHNDTSKFKVLWKCGVCNTEFKTMKALNKHKSLFDDSNCDNTMSPCAYCGDSFSSEDLLEEHVTSQHENGKIRCEECKGMFAHERSLASHRVRAHAAPAPAPAPRRAPAGKPPFYCETCGKKCTTRAHLVYHQRIHTGEKPFMCSLCPKRFSLHQLLQIHFRTHTGERPYKCPQCPKAFKNKAALSRHDRVHSGAKPYPCGHCGRAFSQSNAMKMHVRTVHLKLPAPPRRRRNKPVCTSIESS